MTSTFCLVFGPPPPSDHKIYVLFVLEFKVFFAPHTPFCVDVIHGSRLSIAIKTKNMVVLAQEIFVLTQQTCEGELVLVHETR